MTTTQALRLPKCLLDDLETAIIQTDRTFLTEVARTLGLPVGEVLRKCLGTGATAHIPVLWVPDMDMDMGADTDTDTDADTDANLNIQCPWMDCKGGGLWSSCIRPRIMQTLPCAFHLHATAGPRARLATDPFIRNLPTVSPICWRGHIYWVNFDDPLDFVYREDGSLESELQFIYRDNNEGVRELIVRTRSKS